MDQGLLQGLAEGLRTGLSTYRDESERLYKRETERKKLLKDQEESDERLGLLKEQRELEKIKIGKKRDAEGNWVDDPESLALKKEAREQESARQEGLLKEAQIKKYEAEAAKTAREAKGLLGSDEQSFKTLPKDKQITIENLSKEKARLTGINSQVEELRKQLVDPQISDSDKLATAREQLKLLNSTLGSDAVGAEEVKRLASYLKYEPDPFGPKGMKIGPDLVGYARQLDRINQRSSGTMNTLQKNIDTAYGRKQAGLLSQTQQPQSAETKEWNGVTYKKIGNEWVAQ